MLSYVIASLAEDIRETYLSSETSGGSSTRGGGAGGGGSAVLCQASFTPSAEVLHQSDDEGSTGGTSSIGLSENRSVGCRATECSATGAGPTGELYTSGGPSGATIGCAAASARRSGGAAPSSPGGKSA